MAASAPTPKLPTVLLVEDDGDFRAVICLALMQSGYQVLEAPNAGDAWEIARQRPIAAYVVDLRLPGLDGAVLARQLKQGRGRNVPIVAFTAWPEDERLGSEAFDAVHTKPDLEPLIATLRRLAPPVATS